LQELLDYTPPAGGQKQTQTQTQTGAAAAAAAPASTQQQDTGAKQGQALAVNQVEFHIGYHDDYLQEWCRAHNVQQQAYSSMGRGQLPKTTDPTILAAATAHNKSAAQVALRFVVQKGLAVIPNAKSTAYQLENMDLFAWALTDAEMAALGSMPTPYFRGVQDGMSQMCTDDKGFMARCYYLD
jgi:diketogulonate reductase-like aldo/keto reductase